MVFLSYFYPLVTDFCFNFYFFERYVVAGEVLCKLKPLLAKYPGLSALRFTTVHYRETKN